MPDLIQWEAFSYQNSHPVETNALRTQGAPRLAAAVFAQSEFGFSERSYHCKHGAFTAAVTPPSPWWSTKPPSPSLGYRPLGSLSLRSSLFHEKERRSGFSSDARLHLSFFPFTVHSVPIFVLSKAALTQRRTTERESTGKEPRGGGSYWTTTAADAAASKFRLPNAA